jgi:hypothetical protein
LGSVSTKHPLLNHAFATFPNENQRNHWKMLQKLVPDRPPGKKILRKPGCRHRQALTRRGMTITARFEKSDNKTGRKQWISGRYDPSSGVSGQDEPDKTALMTLCMPVDAVAVPRVVPEPATIQFSVETTS